MALVSQIEEAAPMKSVTSWRKATRSLESVRWGSQE